MAVDVAETARALTMRARIVVASLLLTGCSATLAHFMVDRAVAEPIADQRFMGVVLVARNGHPMFEKAYGLADRERNIPNTPQTPFMIMSVSKQFTAAAIMRLVVERRLGLVDRVNRYLDDWPAEWSTVEIDHLLAHSSGLPIDATYFWLVKHHPEYWPDPNTAPPPFVPQPLVTTPGRSYHYANVGYTLLTLIASKAVGRPFAEILRDEVLVPLDLRHTTIERETPVPGRARGYERSANGLVLREQTTIDIAGAGDMVSTAEDLARFDAAFDGDRFLPRKYCEAMLRPQVERDRSVTLGFGWFISRTAHRHPLQYHTGDGAGFRAFNARLPERNLEIVILSNVHESEMPWIAPLVDRLADLL